MIFGNMDSYARKRAVFLLWISQQVIVVCYLLSAWTSTGQVHSGYYVPTNLARTATEFEIVWTSLLVLIVSIVEVAVLPFITELYLSPFTYGVNIGLQFMAAQLLLFAAVRYDAMTPHPASLSAVTAFASMYFIVGIVKAVALLLWRDDWVQASDKSAAAAGGPATVARGMNPFTTGADAGAGSTNITIEPHQSSADPAAMSASSVAASLANPTPSTASAPPFGR